MSYIDTDEDDVSLSWSSILGNIFRSVMALLLSISSFCLSTSLSTWIIYSRLGILNFTSTLCWLSSPGNKYLCEYFHVQLIFFKYYFNFPWGSCLWKITSLNLEDKILTSSLAYLRFSILWIPMDREKWGQRPFFALCNEVTTRWI